MAFSEFDYNGHMYICMCLHEYARVLMYLHVVWMAC